jgi:hypothetical protein
MPRDREWLRRMEQRKVLWGRVPVKERLLLEGDEKVTFAPHH